MPGLDPTSRRLLAQGETYVIHGAGRVVWCTITVPPGMLPARGAAAGEALGSFLIDQVLQRHSDWLGVVIDGRNGPSVVGPSSLRVMARIFERAEQVRRRVAVIVSSGSMLREQFSDLVRAQATELAIVTESRDAALDWMTAER